MDCEENESRSNADSGSDLRSDDGGLKETVGLLGSCAQRQRFGKGLSVWHGCGEEKREDNKGTNTMME